MSSQERSQQVYTRAISYFICYLAARGCAAVICLAFGDALCLMSQDIRAVVSKGLRSRVVDGKLLL